MFTLLQSFIAIAFVLDYARNCMHSALQKLHAFSKAGSGGFHNQLFDVYLGKVWVCRPETKHQVEIDLRVIQMWLTLVFIEMYIHSKFNKCMGTK